MNTCFETNSGKQAVGLADLSVATGVQGLLPILIRAKYFPDGFPKRRRNSTIGQ